MINNIKKHGEICEELNEIYEYKNERYGDSFNDTIKKYGDVALLTRLTDKLNRLETLVLEDFDDVESRRDVLLDMANYCIMRVIMEDMTEWAEQ